MRMIISDADQIERLISEAVTDAILKINWPKVEANHSPWLTNSEAREYLDVSVATLARLRANETLPYSKNGKSIYYRRADIEKMLQDNMKCHGEEGAR
jgi:hypothetical protein